MPWSFAVAERDHAIQNPTTPDKIRRLASSCVWVRKAASSISPPDAAALRSSSRETLGCRIVGVERAPEFVRVARGIAEAGLDELIEVIERDAREFPLEQNAFDAALCLDASFIWASLDGTLATLAPAVRPGSHVVVGEPYWRQWPLPDLIDPEGFTSLPGTIERFQSARLVPVG